MSTIEGAVALVCAAGVGRRMGGDTPKQYLPIAGKTMLERTLETLAACEDVGRIVLVVAPEDAYIDALTLPDIVELHRVGGAERAQSVRNGLRAAALPEDAWVLVHDAARPGVRSRDVSALMAALRADATLSGAILAQPVADTVKRADASGCILETVDRNGLWRAATPQAFRAGELARALSGPLEHVTDEASAMEAFGAKIALVPCGSANFKVTQPADLELAEMLFKEETPMPEFRIGQGYDSHRLVRGRPLMLGGVHVPHDKGLDGHSDADVLLHALTDALLGASGLGDIGTLFPPSDMRFKGADSAKLLEVVCEKVREAGWRVVNADMTLVAERPKLGDYKADIRRRVAALLGVEPSAVGVKAKTNEKMDAVGREEGMAAHAVVLLTR